MVAQGPPVIGAVQSQLRDQGGGGGPLEDYRNPARGPLAFFYASTRRRGGGLMLATQGPPSTATVSALRSLIPGVVVTTISIA